MVDVTVQSHEDVVEAEHRAFTSILTESSKMSPSEITHFLSNPTHYISDRRANAHCRDIKLTVIRTMTGSSVGKKLNDKEWAIMAKSELWLKTQWPTCQVPGAL